MGRPWDPPRGVWERNVQVSLLPGCRKLLHPATDEMRRGLIYSMLATRGIDWQSMFTVDQKSVFIYSLKVIRYLGNWLEYIQNDFLSSCVLKYLLSGQKEKRLTQQTGQVIQTMLCSLHRPHQGYEELTAAECKPTLLSKYLHQTCTFSVLGNHRAWRIWCSLISADGLRW